MGGVCFCFCFFVFVFAFHLWKRRKFVLGLPKWEFSTGKKHFTPGKKIRKNDFAHSENMPFTPLIPSRGKWAKTYLLCFFVVVVVVVFLFLFLFFFVFLFLFCFCFCFFFSDHFFTKHLGPICTCVTRLLLIHPGSKSPLSFLWSLFNESGEFSPQ